MSEILITEDHHYCSKEIVLVMEVVFYLEANAKLLVLKEGSNVDSLIHSSSIFFRNNKAEECGSTTETPCGPTKGIELTIPLDY